jgi:dCMP deaminase
MDAFLEHHDFATQFEIHAESNAIGWAARYGISTEGTTLYTTVSPCINCAKLIITAGIKEVVYKSEYDRPEDNGIELLKKAKILITKIHYKNSF